MKLHLSTHQKVSRLKNLPESILDRKLMMVGKHKILAEIGRRQELRHTPQLTALEHIKLFSMRFSRKLIPAQQKVIGVLIVIMIMISTSFMAQAAVPGDALWPIKISLEKAEIALSIDSASEGRIHIRHVDNRLKELARITLRPNSINKSENISRVVRRLEKDITAAGQSLKITNVEKKNSQPHVVMALAKDINAKANEAVRILEENKIVLATEINKMETVNETTAATSSSTLLGDLQSSTSTLVASLPEDDKNKQELSENRTVSKVISEVQIVNRDVSHTALSAMIDLIESNRAANRGEVTWLMKFKINEVQQQLKKPRDLQNLVDLINDDFILHRNESRSLVRTTINYLTDAENLLKLDNLSGSMRMLTGARDTLQRLESIIQEAEGANGIKSKPIAPASPSSMIKSPDKQVTIQSLPVEEADENNGTTPDLITVHQDSRE